MTTVAVVRGGRSLERKDSLRSGHHVAHALRHHGHSVKELDVDEGLGPELARSEVVFIALHGRDGEDGTIQALCEALDVPYTGPGPLACQLCFDKVLAKGLLGRAGIATPEAYSVSIDAARHMGGGAAVRRAAERLGYPLVVKPVAQGSALGLGVVRDPEELTPLVMSALDHGDRVLLEGFVEGTDLAVSVLGEPLEALPPVEIRTQSGVFDFETRETPGGADFLCPAPVPEEVARAAAETATNAANALGVEGFARVDLRCGDDGPVVIGVNPCPGLTETSLLPLAVEEAGITFEGFVDRVVEAALVRPGRRPRSHSTSGG